MAYKEGINTTLCLNTIGLRWFNDACYEISLPTGKKIVIDPTIDTSPYKKLGSDALEGADYILLSHTHYDHILNVGDLARKFDSKVFVGRTSALALAKYFDLPGYRVYPCSSGDVYEMDDFTLEVILGKHTKMGDIDTIGHMKANLDHFRLAEDLEETMIMGSFEYYNYLLTLPDHTKILIWGGEASPECIRRAGHYDPDISIVQIPREGARAIADLYKAVGGKVIFPHHHETILDLDGGPDLISDMLDLVHREAPGTEVICPRKGVWYRIGMQIHEEA